ncbi:pilus assembly protein PilM [Deltaproteobacteria bacterium]|nr:pilus assembly protein PilM [Deltaproteobacteria bacterium]
MALSVLGIDIGSYAAKVTVLGGVKGRKANLLGLGMAQLPMEAVLNWDTDPAPAKVAISQAMKNMVARFHLTAKHVSTSISGDSIVVKKITMPAMNEVALKTAILSEAEQYIPFPLAEVNLSHHVLEKDPATGNLAVLLVAARKKMIQNYIDAMAVAKLKPNVIDVDGLAICNAYEFVNPGNRDNVVLVDIGANKIAIIILAHGVPLTIKDESGGGQYLTNDLGDRFGLGQAQAEAVKFGAEAAPNPGEAAEAVDRAAANWIAAVERVLDAARQELPGYQPSRLYLSGGSSLISGLPGEFSKYFNIETQLFNPLLNASYNHKKYDPEYIQYIGPQMAVSFGLALRKVEVQ